MKQMVLIVKAYYCYHKHTNFIEHSFVKINCLCIIFIQNYWGVDCNITDQLLNGNIYTALLISWRNNGNTMGQCISYS